MLETGVNYFSRENKSHIILKTENKENDTRKYIDDNTIRITSVQSKALKGHA